VRAAGTLEGQIRLEPSNTAGLRAKKNGQDACVGVRTPTDLVLQILRPCRAAYPPRSHIGLMDNTTRGVCESGLPGGQARQRPASARWGLASLRRVLPYSAAKPKPAVG
jgi:hypothetical protein